MSDKTGSLIIDLEGKDLSHEEGELLAHPLVGGVILFTRNYESRAQIKVLCQKIRSSHQKPLLIMADQEGGRVQRFIQEFTRLPNMGALGKLYDDSPAAGLDLTRKIGWLMASELLAVGVDLSLAPVLDLDKGLNSVIGNRAFHTNPHVVITLAQAFIHGMNEAGMAATGKHFPGHGSVTLDSHIAIPVDSRSMDDVMKDDILSFAGLIQGGISAIMAAHIIFPFIDSQPVGFSRRWLQDILRNQLKFTGVVLSDDLNMEGANISANYADRVAIAKEAGCDFALLCNNRKGVIQVLDNLSYEPYLVGHEKWGTLQGKFSRVKEPLNESHQWLKIRESLSSFVQNAIKI